jgi:hypothetical protein
MTWLAVEQAVEEWRVEVLGQVLIPQAELSGVHWKAPHR